MLGVQHVELVRSLCLYEPDGIVTSVTDPADTKVAGGDPRGVVAIAASASKVGDHRSGSDFSSTE